MPEPYAYVTGNIPTAGADALAGHLTDAWRIALLALAALCALAAVATGLLVRSTGPRTGSADTRRPARPGSRPADR